MTTIRDVARLAGVGIGTVSRVISGHGAVSAKAAERVRAAIEELHFRPSSIARSLSRRSFGAIGVFVETLRGELYRSIAETMDSELRAVGHHMILVSGQDATQRGGSSVEALESLMETDCDGIIVVSHALPNEELLRIHDHFANVAVMNRRIDGMEDACFSADHVAAGALAARTLFELGHRRIGVISGPGTAPDNVERIQGFLDELVRLGIPRVQVPLVRGDFSTPGGMAATQSLLLRDIELTAIFCANDLMAFGTLAYLRDHGISVPDQISVIGYDDIDASVHTSPSLTSIHIPTVTIAMNAARWLINECYGIVQPIERRFDVTVSMRESVARVS